MSVSQDHTIGVSIFFSIAPITPIYTKVVSIFFSITPIQPLSPNYGPFLRPGYLYRGQDAQQILAEEKASSWDHVMFCVELVTLHLMYSLAYH